MSSRRRILLGVCLIVLFGRALPAEQPEEQPAAADIRGESQEKTSAAGERKLKLSDRSRVAYAKVFDEIVKLARQKGNNEQAEEWAVKREERETRACFDAILDVLDSLREHSELLTAQRLAVELDTVANESKKVEPTVFSSVQMHLWPLDADFERYDAGLRRLESLMELIKTPEGLPLVAQLHFRSTRAYFLHKQKKYEEAEKLYLSVLKDAEEHPQGIPRDEVLSAKFELAGMYAEMDEWRKCKDCMPSGERDYYDDQGKADPQWVAIVLSTNVRYHLSERTRDLEAAERVCNSLVDWMQRTDGAASVPYVEATELMAKVRVAQARYADAIELLDKSARTRAGLFGDDHPSVGRTRAEIDRVRKLGRDDKNPTD